MLLLYVMYLKYTRFSAMQGGPATPRRESLPACRVVRVKVPGKGSRTNWGGRRRALGLSFPRGRESHRGEAGDKRSTIMSKTPLRVYLDTCCLNRPLDDASQERIRLEAEAVRIILRLVELGQIIWVTSEVLKFEVDLNPDGDRRKRVMSALHRADKFIDLDESVIEEAERFEKFGLDPLDALHLASAKAGKAQVFLTVDDTLLRKSRKVHNKIGIRVENPLVWIGDFG